MTATSTASITGRCGPGCPTCADLRRAAVALAGGIGLAGVTSERLARFAGLPVETLELHVCGDADACITAAYRETIAGMQSRFAARLRAATTREQGLRDATANLLAYLARHPDVASFVTVEVVHGGRDLMAQHERLRRESVRSLQRELARFDGDAVAPEVQLEMLVATIGQTIARHVTAGEAEKLPDVLDEALAIVDACAPQTAG
jgi:hypothetical protein